MKYCYSLICLLLLVSSCRLSSQVVKLVTDENRKKIDVLIDGKQFTSFCYPAEIEKPFLFPVYAPNGSVVTRGYPIAPRQGERIDHPHQVGLWFNHGNVNGLDFWGNSSAIPAEKKDKCGHIVVKKIVRAEGGLKGTLEVISDWEDNNGNTILTENTVYIFSGDKDLWTIDHISTLTALNGEVVFSDTKEGMFAIRVDRVFEMPSDEPLLLADSKDNSTEAKIRYNKSITGMYHSSSGKSGDAVWGTRNKWVTLNGKKDNKPVGIALFDNPVNPGFPAYWHARGYGLFSVNNLGRKPYDPSQEELIVKLAKGESIKLVHRLCVQSGSEITPEEAEKIFDAFSIEYK
jgi:hypothetical protein